MQRKRRFEERNGDDSESDVEVVSIKKPKLHHTGSSGWLPSAVLKRMSQWVQNKFTWRSERTERSNTEKVFGNGNGVSMSDVRKAEASSTHHTFPNVAQDYQKGQWPVEKSLRTSQSLTRPALHNGTKEISVKNQTGQRTRRKNIFDAFRTKPRFTAGESVRLDDKVRYKQLLQKFTTVDLKPEDDSTRKADVIKTGPSIPQLTKFFFSANDSILGSTLNHTFDKTNTTRSGSEKIKIQPGRISSPTPSFNGRVKEDSLIRITDISTIPYVQKSIQPRKTEVIDLTEETQTVIHDCSRQTSTKCPDYRDSKFVTDSWIKDLQNTYSAKARENERKIAEAEIKAKIYDERRKEDEDVLEKKIRQQMWIHRKEPVVIEDPPISDIESESDDEVEILDDEEVLPELTDDMLNVINNALSRGNPSQVMVDKFKIQITRGDIATLSGLNWLNDEVINFYMNLLMERGEQEGHAKVYAFNTFFYPKIMNGGQPSVKRWTRRVDVLAVDYILIPVHLGMHWCLAVINFKKKDIQYYDSMGGSNTQCLSALKKYLCDESLDKKKKEFDLEGWKSTIVKDIPQQMNGSDCGMFACKYAEYITRESSISFSQEDMPYFRKRMVYEIVTAKLLQ
ncbi:SUMO1 sentrin specific peptidase 1 [Mactra antiquata]